MTSPDPAFVGWLDAELAHLARTGHPVISVAALVDARRGVPVEALAPGATVSAPVPVADVKAPRPRAHLSDDVLRSTKVQLVFLDLMGPPADEPTKAPALRRTDESGVSVLRSLRKAVGMTQMQFSAFVGLPQPTIPQVERGHFSLSMESAARIARALAPLLDRPACDIAGELVMDAGRKAAQPDAPEAA